MRTARQAHTIRVRESDLDGLVQLPILRLAEAGEDEGQVVGGLHIEGALAALQG